MQALDGMPTAKVLWAGFLVTAINPMELILGIAAGVVIGSASIAPAMAAAALLIDPATATTTVAAYLLFGSFLRLFSSALQCARCWNRSGHGWLVTTPSLTPPSLPLSAQS